MAIFNLFSKRQKELRGEVPDIYTYDALPQAIKVQIVHIWNDAIGTGSEYNGNAIESYKFIVDALCREYGLFQLPTAEKHGNREYRAELANYLLQETEIEKQLDIVELSFKFIDKITRNYSYLQRYSRNEEITDNAIRELNERFKAHGIGFQFLEGGIVKMDSDLLHVEAVKPALKLLNEKNYKGAQQEFLSAYDHYRHGKNKEALNDCLKAFESTMKAICDKRSWTYPPNATAKQLIDVCFNNNLVPAFWQSQLSSLRSQLESSIPTGRNKLSGHGQGSIPTAVPDYLAGYMLHMTASTILFLTTAEKNLT